jgi:hypothetical protein
MGVGNNGQRLHDRLGGQRGAAVHSPEFGIRHFDHGSSPVMVQQRERSMGKPSQVSPGLEQQCGDRARAEKQWWIWNSVSAVLELGGRGK